MSAPRRLWAGAMAGALALGLSAPLPAQDVVAARTLPAGTVLAEEDLAAKDDASGASQQMSELVGLETRRAIYAGRPVSAADLGPPTLVRRNDVVLMLYSRGGLGIRTEGRALDSGGAGEVVRVMNLSSRQPVRAVVTGVNRVEVGR